MAFATSPADRGSQWSTWRSFASTFPSTNPLGRHVGFDTDKPPDVEIVGVLADAQFHDARNPVAPVVFTAMTQEDSQFALDCEFAVRTAADPAGAAAEVRRTAASVDPGLPLNDPRPLAAQVAGSFDSQRLAARLVMFFGLLALTLASVGLYGTIAQNVSLRRRESASASRSAPNAGRSSSMVLRQTCVLLAIGIGSAAIAGGGGRSAARLGAAVRVTGDRRAVRSAPPSALLALQLYGRRRVRAGAAGDARQCRARAARRIAAAGRPEGLRYMDAESEACLRGRAAGAWKATTRARCRCLLDSDPRDDQESMQDAVGGDAEADAGPCASTPCGCAGGRGFSGRGCRPGPRTRGTSPPRPRRARRSARASAAPRPAQGHRRAPERLPCGVHRDAGPATGRLHVGEEGVARPVEHVVDREREINRRFVGQAVARDDRRLVARDVGVIRRINWR